MSFSEQQRKLEQRARAQQTRRLRLLEYKEAGYLKKPNTRHRAQIFAYHAELNELPDGVHVTTDADGLDVVVSITDNGCGSSVFQVGKRELVAVEEQVAELHHAARIIRRFSFMNQITRGEALQPLHERASGRI